jgi:hypothetical protein
MVLRDWPVPPTPIFQCGERMKLDFNAFYHAIRPKAGNETWLLQVKLTFQFPD